MLFKTYLISLESSLNIGVPAKQELTYVEYLLPITNRTASSVLKLICSLLTPLIKVILPLYLWENIQLLYPLKHSFLLRIF